MLVCFSKQSSNNAIPGAACRVEDSRNKSPLSTRQETSVSTASYGSLLEQEAENNLLPLQSAVNTSIDEYTFTELQPVNCQPSTSTFPTSYNPFISFSSTTVNAFANIPNANVPASVPSTSSADQYSDVTWLMTTNQHHNENDDDGQEEEIEELFLEGDEKSDDDFEMRSEIQRCLSLNRDYQVTPLLSY